MASGPDGEVLKREYMLKRSQLKSKFKTVNFRSRWFVLTERCLTYHDGSLSGGAGKEKGRIPLRDVTAVELADDEDLGRRPNGFQVVYSLGAESCILYIISVHADMRSEWMELLRKACLKLGQCRFNTFYHPGVWLFKENRWSCCDSISKRSEGCRPVTFQYESEMSKGSPPDSISPPSRDKDVFPAGSNNLAQRPPPSRPVPKPRVKETPSNDVQKKVIARYEYQATEPGDLSLVVGDVYYVLDESKQAWWKAKNLKGEEGYIPANYVEDYQDNPNSLAQYDWYYPSLSRQQSEEILKKEKREGCFLVRDSSQPGMYTLSIFTQEVQEGMVRHYHIKKNKEGLLYLSEKHSFQAIPELIYYHKHNSGGLVVRLRSPPSDRSSSLPATQGFGHDKWEVDPSDLEIFEELGKGQFGRVCKARFKGRRDVAVKEMQTGTMREDDFIDEAKTMMQFSHKNLVQLYGVCTQHQPMYIVLEFMKHGALLQFLRRRKLNLLSKPDSLLEMCIQVCDAMKYLEDQQVIHRDLAARNCLVGDNTVVKVADFGLARFVLDDEYTSSSGTKFPVKWAPPEVLSYTKFSSKSDVWAFGVLMWEIWTGGEFPYGRMRNPEVVDFVCNRNGVLSQPEHCPQPIYDIMRECWKKVPEQRPRFQELHTDLVTVTQQQNYVS